MKRALPAIVAGLGVVLVLTGIAVFAAPDPSPADSGWSSYAPLQPQVPGPSDPITYVSGADWAVSWTTGHLIGAGLAVLGALVLAAVGGWLLGRRSGRRGNAPT